MSKEGPFFILSCFCKFTLWQIFLRNAKWGKILSKGKFYIQVNFFQKGSFYHQLTTYCSLIYNLLHRKIQVQNMLCTNCFLFRYSKQFLYTICSEFVFFWVRSCKSMNNLSSYCGLTDSRMSASDTDLPVLILNLFFKTNSEFRINIVKTRLLCFSPVSYTQEQFSRNYFTPS